MPDSILSRVASWRTLRPWIVGLGLLIALLVVLRFTLFAPPAVTVAQVMRGNLPDEVEGTGTVTADVLANIASEITGRVESVVVDEGDFVHKGEIIAMLDRTGLRRQVEAADAKVAATNATAAERRREWVREMGLVKTGAASVEDLQQYAERLAVADSTTRAAQAEAAALQYSLSLARIPSLFDGIVVKRRVVPGDSVVPGQSMFTVAGTRLIYVRAHIDQDFTGDLRKGETATVILRGRQHQPLEGTVLRIDPQADAATEETVAEVAFTLPRGEFELGEWANVFIRLGTARSALLVPNAAVMRMMGQAFVFTVDRDDVVRREEVRILAQSPRYPMIAVAGSLRPGERVVVMPMGLETGAHVRPREMHRAPMQRRGAMNGMAKGMGPPEGGGHEPRVP